MILEWFQDGEVTTEEFIKAIRTTSMGKPFDGLPACLKTFIGAMFKTIDIDGMMGFYLSLFKFSVVIFFVVTSFTIAFFSH